MKWAIDRLEDDIAIIENIETGDKKEVNISLLPSYIKEGNVLVSKDDKYYLDQLEEENRRSLIEERFKRLRNND